MFGRFLGRFFWNFYDYLGGNLLLGTVVTFAFFATLYAANRVLAIPCAAWIRVAFMALLGAAGLCILAAGGAGLGAFATRAARDEAARLAHFKAGISGLFWVYLKLLLLSLFVAAIVSANILFYGGLARTAASVAAKIGFVSVAMLFAWGGLALGVYSVAVFGAPARYGPEAGLRETLRRTVVLFFVTPGLWLLVTVFVGLLWALCALSIVGVVFVLPILATASSTALHLAAEQAQFLAQAREDLGPGHPVRVYRRRAAELTEAADARRPRRTLRELIRPWEA
ncbi:MAG: hypothetical protein N2111_00140 [Candidatus Sumerlaeaceae bacterium]|nr:hypothetical protein [Candidatus Sumerlaeaceae bacterium]